MEDALCCCQCGCDQTTTSQGAWCDYCTSNRCGARTEEEEDHVDDYY